MTSLVYSELMSLLYLFLCHDLIHTWLTHLLSPHNHHRGLSPGIFNPTPNVTVFPNTISQAATMDLDLISRISRATALEGRIVNQVNYRLTGGTTFQGVSCDGGPLANSAHDARWGVSSELKPLTDAKFSFLLLFTSPLS